MQPVYRNGLTFWELQLYLLLEEMMIPLSFFSVKSETRARRWFAKISKGWKQGETANPKICIWIVGSRSIFYISSPVCELTFLHYFCSEVISDHSDVPSLSCYFSIRGTPPTADFDRELFINSKTIYRSANATFLCRCSD